MKRRLVCYTRTGHVEVPLSEDERFNAALERIARLGGGIVYREDARSEEERLAEPPAQTAQRTVPADSSS